MNRSMSPTDVDEQSVSFEEQIQPARGGFARSVLPAHFRTRDPKWLLVDEGFTLAREHEIESLFAIANGYVGNRGSLAEGSPLSAPATFVAGVFEQFDTPGSVPQLMILPDWTAVRIWIDRQPLSMQQGEVLEHRRILDLRRGMLWREWRHRDPDGRTTRIVAYRLASLADRHLLLHSVAFTAENYSSAVRFESAMEVADPAVSLLAPDWKVRSSSARANVLPLALRTPGRGITVAFGVASQLLNSTNSAGRRTVDMNERRIRELCEVQVEVGSTCHLHRLISVFSSRETSKPFACAMRHLGQVIPKGVSATASAHALEWESRWQATDIEVQGDDSLQQALRFGSYHLISAANPEDSRVSIGARMLTGAAYKGHVFWDTEIYMLPFYIFTHPPSARALLEYRYHTLDAARAKARSFGFRGAMFAWESADTGEETTPRMVIAPNGEVLIIPNGEKEVHITADIAFGIWHYWKATADDDFFVQRGAEIMLEAARFWASRGAIEQDGAFHIRHVIGPDEYHENVDDNAYTNLTAAWSLRRGAETAKLLEQRWPDRWRELITRLQFTNEEVGSWTKLGDAMFTGFDPKTLLFEQFRGYFDKKPIDLKSFEPRSAAMDMILGHEPIQQTNIVKQADVILGMYLLWDEIAPDVRAANFRYYEPRTGHGSSLSPSIHALIATRLGNAELAQKYLKQASEIDLGNNMGNAAGGVHAAALGGLWQAIVFGFAGLKTHSDGLSFAPNLLSHWRRLAFPLQWRGRKLRVSIEPRTIRVAVSGTQPFRLGVEGGAEINARPEGDYVAERTEHGWKPWGLVHSSAQQKEFL
jgi:trehalose/maltose hydrolase-like predicted phosphorylase